MKEGISAGIGLFISFVGLQSAHIIVSSPATLVTLGNFTDPVTYMSLIGLFISIILVVNNVRGALFLGMIITSISFLVISAYLILFSVYLNSVIHLCKWISWELFLIIFIL